MLLNHRRIAFALAAVLPLAAQGACSASNGDAIPSPVYDAADLDVGTNPGDPEGGGADGSSKPDAARDAQADAPKDAKDAGPNTAPVAINEIFVDNDFLGDGTEYVELRAAPGTPADDLKLRVIGSDGQVRYDVSVGNAGDAFGAGGLWVVGGNQTFKLNVTDRVDRALGLNSWGLDNTRGAIQIIRGTLLLDVVGYGTDPDAGALPPPASPPTVTGEGPIATVPTAPPGTNKPAHAFGRKPAAPDTNNNAADFCAMEASPGYPQKSCL